MAYVVGIADMKISTNPGKLSTIGLGSCVGIVLHDPFAKVGALIHAMLPSVTYSKSKDNRAKFVDTAVPTAIEEMEKLGARKHRITAKLVGGARMFTDYGNGAFIGDRNIRAARNVLKENGVKIIARDTGGAIGRTVEFDISTGRVLVKTAMRGVIEL